MRSPLRAHIFVLSANIIYGINYSIGKLVLRSVPPFGIVLVRVSGAAIIFFLLHALLIREKIERSDHKKLLIASIFGVAVNQLLFFKGLSLTSEIHSALIMITTPLIVLLMAWFILKERITLLKMIGIITGGCGVALLILHGTASADSPSNLSGDICIMINAASFALFLVIAKPLMNKYHPITIAKWIFIYGCILVFPFGIKDVMHTSWSAMHGTTVWAITYVVLGATVLAYLFNMLGLSSGDPTLVSVYIYTQPLIASFIAVTNGNDHFDPAKLIASILVFTGVALVSFTDSGKSLKAGV